MLRYFKNHNVYPFNGFGVKKIKMTKHFWKLSAVAIAVVFLFSFIGNSWAQSNGLGVTPRVSLTSRPGGTIRDSLRVSNLSSNQPLNLRVNIIDFRPAGETGTPQLIRDPNAEQTPWSLKPFLTIPETFTVPAGQSANVPFTIKFPDNVGAGSYYSAIEYEAVGATDEQRVNIAASSATLVFINVEGNAAELLNLLDFGASDNGKIKSIFSEPPQTFGYRLKNGGNLNESPAGSIVVKNMFGDIKANIDNINPKNELALIGQTRRFEVCYPKSTETTEIVKAENCQRLKLLPGRYTAELVMLYGQNGQPVRQIGAKASFWYLPTWFVALLVIVLAALAWVGYRTYSRFNRPKRRR